MMSGNDDECPARICSCKDRKNAESAAEPWENGDPALVKCSDGEWRPAMFGARLGAPSWSFPDGTFRRVYDSEARPLTLTDPVTGQPYSPPVEEPQADASVIRATCACYDGPRLFVRDDSSDPHTDDPWKSGCGHHKWSDLSKVEVL